MPSTLLSAGGVWWAAALSPRAVVGQPHPTGGDARPLPTLPSGAPAPPRQPPSPTHRLGAAFPPTLAGSLSCVPLSFLPPTRLEGSTLASTARKSTHSGRASPWVCSLTIRHYGGKPLRLQPVGAACFSPWCRSASRPLQGCPAAILPHCGWYVSVFPSRLILAHPPVPPWLPASGLCPEARSPPPPSRL